MPKGKPVMWTPAMDDVVRRSTIAAAAARLGLSAPTIVNRRRQLREHGRAPKSTGAKGAPPGTRGPRPRTLEVIRLFGLGYSPPEITRKTGLTRQGVHQALDRFVRVGTFGRRWCPKCLKPHQASLKACPACGTGARGRRGGCG
jgi:hypothetical protein